VTNDKDTRNPRPCACGCGAPTRRTWVQGHDSKALHEDLAILGCSSVASFHKDVLDGRIRRVGDRR
jgi:hypothetical protein